MSKKLLIEYHALCPDGICDISMLNESERKMKAEGYTILTGILSTANELNGNGRIYPKSILEREIENYQQKIRSRTATGELDHPQGEVVELKNASHMVLRTWWDGNKVMGTIKVLKSTPAGQILEGLIRDGVQLGISSRALGSVRETSQGTVVEEDLALICFDAVSDPSNLGSYLQLAESKKINENKLFDKAYRINAALNEILRNFDD